MDKEELDDNLKIILVCISKNLCCGCLDKRILMSTHNTGFYEKISKIISDLLV